jgi:apolipoprotein N-acyltransferase
MRRSLPLLAAIGSGAAMALALPLVVQAISLRQLDPGGRLEPVAWVALSPLLVVAARASRPRAAFGLGLAGGLAYFAVAIHWVSHAMTAFGGLSLAFSAFAVALLVGWLALFWGAAAAAAHQVRARLGWPLWAHLPFAWTALELARTHLLTGFPWGNLGYTQVRTLPVAQLGALLGVDGVAFLVALVNAALAEAWLRRGEGRPIPWRALGAVAGVVALVAAGGAWRLASLRREVAAAPTVRVGVVQPNVDQRTKNQARDHVGYILGRLYPLTEEADRRGADLVAWPEAAFPLYVRPPDARSFRGGRGGLPELTRAHVLLGAAALDEVLAPDGRRVLRVENAVYLARPDGDVLGRYVKNHLVPFGEYVPLARWIPFIGRVVPNLAPAAPGRALTVLEFAGPDGPVRLAPLICFDAIFPELARRFARQGPDLLVNPTNDAWYGYSSGPYQFLAIVQMRAIETGRSVVRPAYAGVSALILPTGELMPGALEVGPVDADLAPDPDEPARLLMGDVPILRGRTPFTSIGPLFDLACALVALAALALAARRGRGGATHPEAAAHGRSHR